MWRLGFDTIPAYLLIVALLTLLVAVIIWQRHRTGKTVSVWVFSGLVGILLGSVGSYALARLAGYTVIAEALAGEGPGAMAPPEVDEDEDEEGAVDEPGGGMPGMDMPGMGGPGRRMFGPRPKRDLTSLVRKIELLTGQIGFTLSEEQAKSLLETLAEVEAAESMSDEDAQAAEKKILAVLTDEQKAQLEAIGLPRRFGRGRRPGAQPQDPDANPFQQEENAKALKRLRQRFASGPSEEAAPEAEANESQPAQAAPAEAEPTEGEAKPAAEEPADQGEAAQPPPAETKPASEATEAEPSAQTES